MWGLPQKQNARRAYKIRLCGHLRRYKKIVKKTYMIYTNKMLNIDNLNRKRLNFRHGYKNPRPHFCNRSTLIIHIWLIIDLSRLHDVRFRLWHLCSIFANNIIAKLSVNNRDRIFFIAGLLICYDILLN